jgi:hypothetical protein
VGRQGRVGAGTSPGKGGTCALEGTTAPPRRHRRTIGESAAWAPSKVGGAMLPAREGRGARTPMGGLRVGRGRRGGAVGRDRD